MTVLMSGLVSVETAAQAAYIVAALLFILALAGLSRHETAKSGNTFGIAGMAVALVATIALAVDHDISGAGLALLVAAMLVGAAIGLWRARVVEMTGMPELIALLHSFVGLAAVLVGWNGYLHVEGDPDGAEAAIIAAQDLTGIHSAEVFIGVFIGAVTFTGSIVAFLKLSARIKSSPSDAAGQERVEPGRAGRVRRVHGVVRDRPGAVAADHRHRASRWPWAGTWSPPSAAATCRWSCRC